MHRALVRANTDYSFNDEIGSVAHVAGSVNGTANDPGPGVRLATSANVVVSNGDIVATGSGVAGEAGWYWVPAIMRRPGRIFIQKVEFGPSGAPVAMWGFRTTPGFDLTSFNNAGLSTGPSAVVLTGRRTSDGSSVALVTLTYATDYETATILRAAGRFIFLKSGGHWLLTWIDDWDSTGILYVGGSITTSAKTLTTDYGRTHRQLYMPAPLLSDGFSSGASSDGLGHAEGVSREYGQGGSGIAWVGGTWTVSGGKLLNTPTAGADLLTDGAMENWLSASNLTSWSETPSGTSTINREGTDVHGGSFAARLDIDASDSLAFVLQAGVATIGKWYQFQAWIKSSVAAKTAFLGTANNPFVVSRGTAALTTSYAQYTATDRAAGTGVLFCDSVAVSSSIFFDDLTFKELTLSTLLRLYNVGISDVFVEAQISDHQLVTQVGIAMCWDSDSSPANGVVAILEGNNLLRVDKCVAGVWSTVSSTAAAYSANAKLIGWKSGTSFRFYYNGSLVVANTISDAGIINNTLHGVFSTDPANKFESIDVYAVGSEGQHSVLDNLNNIPPHQYDQFRDALAAGSINGTVSTPGPGKRVVVDTESKLTTSGDKLVASGGKATPAWGDPGVWLDGQQRVLGLVGVFDIYVPAFTTLGPEVGFDSNQNTFVGSNGIYALTSTTLRVAEAGADSVIAAVYAVATRYQIAVVIRAAGAFYLIRGGIYTAWTLIWVGTAGTTAIIYPTINTYGSAFNSEFARIARTLWAPPPILSDGFSSGASSDGAGHVESVGLGAGGSGIAWVGGTWTVSGGKLLNTPTFGAELLTDPGMEAWTSATNLTSYVEGLNGTSTVNQETSVFHGGANAARLDVDGSNSLVTVHQSLTTVVGTWYAFNLWSRSGSGTPIMSLTVIVDFNKTISTTYAQYFSTNRATATSTTFLFKRNTAAGLSLYFDDASVKALTFTELLRITNLSIADVFIDVQISDFLLGTQIGIAMCWDSDSAPANGVLAYLDGAGNIKVDKLVGGTWTSVSTTAAAYSANARLTGWKLGTSWRFYYNNAFVVANTISDAGIISNTRHGVFSTDLNNKFEAVTIYPTGTELQHALLDTL